MSLPLLHLTGTPQQQGLAHGEALRERIAHNIDAYITRFWVDTQLSKETVLERAGHYIDTIEAQNRDYFAAMQGVATGANVPFVEIVMLNARYELIYYEWSRKKAPEECTSFAVSAEKTINNHLIIGQNWDWLPDVKGAILHTEEADGLETMAFTEAGIVGAKIGMNSAQIGICINGLTSVGDEWRVRHKPFHVRCYEILRQRNLEDAIDIIAGENRSCAANFLLAQVPNQVANIEAATAQINRIGWQDGCLAHANHFVDPEAAGIVEAYWDRRQYSCLRQARMEALLNSKPKLSVSDLQTFLTDRENAPDSLCKLGDDPARPRHEQTYTVTGAILDLTARELWFSDGPPCLNAFEKYTLNS